MNLFCKCGKMRSAPFALLYKIIGVRMIVQDIKIMLSASYGQCGREEIDKSVDANTKLLHGSANFHMSTSSFLVIS